MANNLIEISKFLIEQLQNGGTNKKIHQKGNGFFHSITNELTFFAKNSFGYWQSLANVYFFLKLGFILKKLPNQRKNSDIFLAGSGRNRVE
jgi:hypothetical protein